MNGCNQNFLKEVFEMVKLIQNKRSGGLVDLPEDDPQQTFIMLSALMIEVGEVCQEDTRWKILVSTKKELKCNKELKGYELSDVFIYLICAILYSDIDYEEFEKIVIDKLEKVYSE